MCLYPIDIYVRPKGLKLLPMVGLFDRVEDYRIKQTVACGHCLECLRNKSIEWAFRIMDECSLYEKNCFLTLTYNEDNLYYNEFGEPSVSRREIQLFLKRLREQLSPLKIRFFACGEYGSKYGRPHYHLIIFNWFPADAYFFKKDKNDVLYRSPILEKVWTKGFSSVGMVTYDTALYCAKYMNKTQFDKHYLPKPKFEEVTVYPDPPFIQMSNRPGIGYGKVYDCDLNSDRIYRGGKSTKIPRYYLKVMERDGVWLDDFRERRKKQGELIAKTVDLQAKRKKYNDMFYRVVVKRP